MKIPSKDLGSWAMEQVEKCNISVAKRLTDALYWRSYFLDGAAPGQQATYNQVFKHIDTLSSYLFSPADTRFVLDWPPPIDAGTLLRGLTASAYLTKEFRDRKVATAFSDALPWSLVYGKCFLKMGWKDGLRAWPVMPYELGVYREDYTSLEDQEAICHTMYITMDELERRLEERPDKEEIIKKIAVSRETRTSNEDEDGFHRIFIGGTQPIILGGLPAPAGFANVRPNSPIADISPEVAHDIVKLHELWVWDDELHDYVTIQVIPPDIVIEGKYKKRNCFLDGYLPFVEICANPINGYFWGFSEISNIRKLHDMAARRMEDVRRLLDLQVKPPKAYIGFDGITDEKAARMNQPSGWIAESAPSAKVENLGPTMPPDIFKEIQILETMFQDMAGLTPMLQGKGEHGGVRSQGHAEALIRTSSPRIKDRALLIEQQVAEAGDLCFKLLQDKEAKLYFTEDKKEFLLKQMPEGYSITVDAHSSSPAFSEDAIKLAFELRKVGAIDNEDLLRLTPVPMVDTLISRLRQRQAAHEQQLKEHPELLVEETKRELRGKK